MKLQIFKLSCQHLHIQGFADPVGAGPEQNVSEFSGYEVLWVLLFSGLKRTLWK